MFNFLKKIMPTSDTTPNPLLSITDLIDYASVRPEHVVPAVKSLAAQVEAALEKADAPSTPASWENTVEPLEKAVLAFGRAWGAVGHLQSVVDTPALRDAFNEALPIATDLFLRLSQDEKLCDKYRELAASPEFEELAPVRRRIVERELRDFRLSGASLPKVQRERVKAIGQELSQTSQKFSENLLDATNAYELLIEDEKRLAGIPEETLALYRASAEAAGKKGFRLTLQYPSYLPAMKYCADRGIRHTRLGI